MNMFYLDDDFDISAQYHVNKHVVKIILETTQLLSNVQHYYQQPQFAPYKPTHMNHPMSIWVRECKPNYDWACNYGLALCREYRFRYGREHKCYKHLSFFSLFTPHIKMLDKERTEFPLCMPDYCKLSNPVDSYRNYYIQEKSHLFFWKKRNKPSWISC